VCRTCLQRNLECTFGPSEPDHLPEDLTDQTDVGGEGYKSYEGRISGQADPQENPSPLAVGLGHRPPTTSIHPIKETNTMDISHTPVNHSYLNFTTRNRMPYFRYFGPTAIMPGFKQMVVKVSEKQHSTTGTPSVEEPFASPSSQVGTLGHGTSSQRAPEGPVPFDPPFYDTSELKPSQLIVHLCETFFTHFGCSFPFLQQNRFMRDLEEKQVDAILVDSVCALAARFSTELHIDLSPPERGQAFARRAKSAIIDAFPCPSVAAVQAAMLLAYDEFGANRDSGLWMYLGIAVRMAQDIGMQKVEGLRYVGRTGPTPHSLTNTGRAAEKSDNLDDLHLLSGVDQSDDVAEQMASEKERVDTFWAVFMLDRYVSSGTGRPVALRDEDIEVSFPPLDSNDTEAIPWPALIRIVHLYGKVSDILNSIKKVSHVTPEVIKQLSIIEIHLTDIYQGLSPRLHFNASNFQHYVKLGEGTSFIMLHFWFHTLIVLLHQPTLLHSFDSEIQQLFHNSKELSMSSAKTIADILAFAELVSGMNVMGTPFTTYVIFLPDYLHTLFSVLQRG
jgi:hypothetical protein